jgi:hypothetical protein
MPQVLTTNALIQCPHGGVGKSTATDPKWVISGGEVLLHGDPGVLSCIFIPPCTGYQLRSMGLNATQVDGRQVMLVTDFTQSFTGFPLTITEVHQTFDSSTPAPIPVGASPAPMPPELQETDQPTVTAVPPFLAFSKAAFGNTGQPPSLVMTFSLQTQFPLGWMLTMLNAPAVTSTDITKGVPPNILVAPAGGSWSSPALAVTVTILGTFMAALPIGDHYFVLTAVNFRGKSHYAEVQLAVSL